MSDHKNKNQNTYRGVSYNNSDTASKKSSSLTEGVYRGVKFNLNNLKRDIVTTSKGVYRGVEFSI
tara:strand:+ start:613 stop:807 length:195 start_codon:yes stop_codon:yes gene_type:complete